MSVRFDAIFVERCIVMRLVTTAVLFIILLAAPDVARAGDPVLALLDPYFRIQSQLTTDSTDGVKDLAAAIVKEAQALGKEGKDIAAAADSLGGSSTLAAARTAFGELSEAVIAYAERTKANPGADVNTMYCPMVKKSWMQKGEQVKNPYYGKAMVDCGEKKKKAS
jgi:hypothetical protein